MANGFGGGTGNIGSGSNSFGGSGGDGGFNIGALIQMLMQSMQQFNNPAQSPLYKGQAQALMNARGPMEEQATTNLQDMFRNAGNMSSGAYGMAGSNLQSNFVRDRETGLAQLLGQTSRALGQPMSIYAQLIQTLMQQQGQGQQNNSWANIPLSVGLGPEENEAQLVNQGSWNQ